MNTISLNNITCIDKCESKEAIMCTIAVPNLFYLLIELQSNCIKYDSKYNDWH